MDYSPFAIPSFDANEYANAVLAGEPYPPQPGRTKTGTTAKTSGLDTGKEDISVAISKLTFGIEDVSKQIKAVVTAHHDALLVQAGSVNNLQGSFQSVRGGLEDLESSIEKLRLKIRVPYDALDAYVVRLRKLQHASELLRRTARFVVVARRLEFQMDELSKHDANEETASTPRKLNGNSRLTSDLGMDTESDRERIIAKAAMSIAELVSLLDVSSDADLESEGPPPQLQTINVVVAHIPAIDAARAKVTAEMETMVLSGLANLNQSLLASSLQTAYNLHVLPDVVQSLISDLTQAVESRIKSAFDVSRISKEAAAKEPVSASQGLLYKSRVRTEPTNVTAPQWAAALWTRLESLVEEMAGCCVKVCALEKVLKLKRDTVSQIVFLDECMKLLENKPSAIFWTTLARSLEKQARDAAKGSTFLQQTLTTGYPRLLRLFHDFFAKIAVHTDTVYSQTQQSPETVLIMRALSNFEALYLSRSSNRLNETVGQTFAGGSKAPPGMNEGMAIARTIANELDTAKFDPLLVRAVSKSVVGNIDLFLSRVDGLIAREWSSVNLLGPLATPQQLTNAALSTCLFHVWSRLSKLEDEVSENVLTSMRTPIQDIFKAYERSVEPILSAISRELSAIIARLHHVNFSKSADVDPGFGGGPSPYMKDLVDKLHFVKVEILNKYNIPEASSTWIQNIVKTVVRTFVLHVSIAKPLSESGKLQLTSDMTELEFALSAFIMEGQQKKGSAGLEKIGSDYLALRAMRPLLFLENAQLAQPSNTAGLPPLIVLHHIMVRSSIPLPHSLHGWQEAEYVRWVGEHTPEEAWSLVESGLAHWEKMAEVEGSDSPSAREYIQLARTVLRNAQRKD